MSNLCKIIFTKNSLKVNNSLQMLLIIQVSLLGTVRFMAFMLWVHFRECMILALREGLGASSSHKSKQPSRYDCECGCLSSPLYIGCNLCSCAYTDVKIWCWLTFYGCGLPSHQIMNICRSACLCVCAHAHFSTPLSAAASFCVATLDLHVKTHIYGLFIPAFCLRGLRCWFLSFPLWILLRYMHALKHTHTQSLSLQAGVMQCHAG